MSVSSEHLLNFITQNKTIAHTKKVHSHDKSSPVISCTFRERERERETFIRPWRIAHTRGHTHTHTSTRANVIASCFTFVALKMSSPDFVIAFFSKLLETLQTLSANAAQQTLRGIMDELARLMASYSTSTGHYNHYLIHMIFIVLHCCFPSPLAASHAALLQGPSPSTGTLLCMYTTLGKLNYSFSYS